MYFKNRQDAGRQLALLLKKYIGQDTVVFALPRGGIVPADEIAIFLNAPLSLILAHKIGHPYQPEYAIAAISERGHLVGSSRELDLVNEVWLEHTKIKEMEEIKRKRKFYLVGKKDILLEGKIALIVDDGVATGLTMQAGILELRDRNPKKIIVVIPVVPRSTATKLQSMADDVVAVEIPDDKEFRGSVGAYYDEFYQVEDAEVIRILKKY
ncbi:MAG: phosphoribosyl transferase [Parachlamydiaceae bacterium]|nr:phosphoribosyl transferase [Parachlamydiaceae bacterium]